MQHERTSPRYWRMVEELADAAESFDWLGGHWSVDVEDWTDRGDFEDRDRLAAAVAALDRGWVSFPVAALVDAAAIVVSNYDFDYGDVGQGAMDAMTAAAERVRQEIEQHRARRPEYV